VALRFGIHRQRSRLFQVAGGPLGAPRQSLRRHCFRRHRPPPYQVFRGVFLDPSIRAEGFSLGAIYPFGESSSYSRTGSPEILGRPAEIPGHGCLFFLEHSLLFFHRLPSICAPEEGRAWHAERELAFRQIQNALVDASALGHPVQDTPYRLYADASDFALGASLQQVQPILVGDLKGASAYDQLQKTWAAKVEAPSLVISLAKDAVEWRAPQAWGDTLDSIAVFVERVIVYWSRTLSPTERNYSATEREALGAKEALVKFQPFIEGETVILITDRAALQWARVYENANRRLVAWGAAYAAYPGLKIVHRPGRIHSNVNPFSRLPRTPPHNSPIRDDNVTIVPDERKQNIAQASEDHSSQAPAKKAAFSVFWWEDMIEKFSYTIQTRRQKLTGVELAEDLPVSETMLVEEPLLPFSAGGHWTYPIGVKPSGDGYKNNWSKRSHLLVSMNPEITKRFTDAYEDDPYLFQEKVSR
jgi:hypothetical protein